MSRDMDKSVRKPRLSDLKETGSIEEDADGVGMLWRPDEKADAYGDAVPTQLLYEKNRNGPTGPVNLTLLRNITRFENAGKIDPADYRQDNDAD
jgi:replicative DNA helicase